jgi:hypothetical protein
MRAFPDGEVVHKFGLGCMRSLFTWPQKQLSDAEAIASASDANRAGGSYTYTPAPPSTIVLAGEGAAYGGRPQQMTAAALALDTAAMTSIRRQIAVAARTLIDVGLCDDVAAALARFPRGEFTHEQAVGLLACLAQVPEVRGHRGFAATLPPLVASILRFPTSHTIGVAGCNALWGLGCDPALRAAIHHHPDGLRALAAAMAMSAERHRM